MNIIYLSSACIKKDVENINKKLNQKLQVSSINYHNNLIDGLTQNNANVFSIYGLPVSSHISKKKIWKRKKEKKSKCEYIQIGFINLPIMKYISMNYNINKEIRRIIKSNKNDNNIIIFDGAYVSIYPTIKKYIDKIKIYAIIADVYDYMAEVENKSKHSRIIVKITKKYISNINKKIKGFVFLNKNMAKLYNTDNYIVIEGIAEKQEINNIKKTENKKIIMYAGGLFEKFGVKNLIDAFMELDQENYELHLYGYGNMEEYILKMANKDRRIKYFGMQNHKTVISAEKNATILVNPRPINYEFQKYSFPSKLIEYMSSGTPVITTKIDGMPEEYNEFLFYFDNYNKEGIKEKIDDVLKIDEKKRRQLAFKAYNFIQEKKTPRKQAKKIMEMVEKNEENKL